MWRLMAIDVAVLVTHPSPCMLLLLLLLPFAVPSGCPGRAPGTSSSACCFRAKDTRGAPVIPLIPVLHTSIGSYDVTCHPSDALADAAIKKGATDNVSVITVCLEPLMSWLDTQSA